MRLRPPFVGHEQTIMCNDAFAGLAVVTRSMDELQNAESCKSRGCHLLPHAALQQRTEYVFHKHKQSDSKRNRDLRKLGSSHG